jgi:hypothetical protein
MFYWSDVNRSSLSLHRALAVVMALFVALGAPSSLTAQAGQGVITGRVTDDSKKPFSDYAARLRDAGNGTLLKSAAIDARGEFTFREVPVGKPYLLELVRTKNASVVCTAGPYMAAADLKSLTPVRLGCGRVPAAYWVLAAAAGTAAIAVVSRPRTATGSAGSASASATGAGTQSVSR